MSEDTTGETTLGFIVTSCLFAGNVFVALCILVYRRFAGQNFCSLITKATELGDDDELTVRITVSTNHAELNYPFHKRMLQNFHSFLSNHVSLHALWMIFLTLGKLFLQLFDAITDVLVAKTFWMKNAAFFVISIVLISAPMVAKWKLLGDFITKKKGKLPEWLSWAEFIFPIGFLMPLAFDAYLLAENLEGYAISHYTGIKFEIEDSLFSIQRSFALAEVQIESFPQALFQGCVLIHGWATQGSADDLGLISLSIVMSTTSLVMQVMSLDTLAKKELFDSIFNLITALANGTFLTGINRIQNSHESVLNLYETDLNEETMDLVRVLLHTRPNMNTVILNPKMLLDQSKLTMKWLWDLNSIRLRFLLAESLEDIDEAWNIIDYDNNGYVNVREFKDAGEYARSTWLDRYGTNYEMNQNALLNFIRRENVELEGTVFSVFEVLESKRFPESIRTGAHKIVDSFLSRIDIEAEPSKPINDVLRKRWRDSTGDFVALNGSTIETWHCEHVDSMNIRCLGLAHLVDLDLSSSNITNVRMIGDAYLPKLKSLSFSKCTNLNDSQLHLETHKVPNLEILDLSDSNWKNAKLILENDHSRLRKLSFCNCASLESDYVQYIQLPELEELNLGDSSWKNLKVILQSDHENLKKLMLFGCRALDVDSLEFIGLPQLEELNLRGTKWKNVKMLLESEHPSLTRISFEECKSLDSESVEFINLPQLEELDFTWSNWSNAKVILESGHENLKKVSFAGCKSLANAAPQCSSKRTPELDDHLENFHRSSREQDRAKMRKFLFAAYKSLDNGCVEYIGLPQLQDLDFHGSNWENAKVILESHHSKMRKLSFEDCKNLDVDRVEFVGLPRIEELDLRRSNWKDAKMILESKHVSLKRLLLAGCKSLDSESVKVIRVPKLEELDFTWSNWENAQVILHSDHPNLKKLSFGGCLALDCDSVKFIGVPQLEELDLRRSNWTNANVVLASGHIHLKKLSFERCESIDSDSVEYIGLPKLEDLDLRRSNWKNAKVILESDHSGLKKLSFEHCEKIDSESVKLLGLPRLEELDFTWSSWKNAKVILESDHANLKRLSFEYCSLDSDSVNFIKLPKLEELDFDESSWRHAKVVLENEHPSLKRLSFESCKFTDTRAVTFLGLPFLEELDLRRSNWEDAQVILESQHPNLKKLVFKHCQSLDSDSVQFLCLPQLEDISFRASNWKNAKVIMESNHSNLKRVSFRSCKNLDDESVKYVVLPQLENLDLRKSNWKNERSLLSNDKSLRVMKTGRKWNENQSQFTLSP